MEKILVIEDDRAIQKALKRLFEAEGYTLQIAATGTAGLEAFRASAPSLVVLDLKLPGLPGRDVCREIKKEATSVPVIIVSATTEEVDKVLLLELGADDYVTKPFSPRELLARVHAVLRRASRPKVGDQYSFDDVAVDFAKMEVVCGGKPVTLTPQEFKILKYCTELPAVFMYLISAQRMHVNRLDTNLARRRFVFGQ